MIIVMEENASEDQIVRVVDRLVGLGFDIHRSTGSRYTILGAVGSRTVDTRLLELLEGVSKVVRISSPYKLAARAFKPEAIYSQCSLPYMIGSGLPIAVSHVLCLDIRAQRQCCRSQHRFAFRYRRQ